MSLIHLTVMVKGKNTVSTRFSNVLSTSCTNYRSERKVFHGLFLKQLHPRPFLTSSTMEVTPLMSTLTDSLSKKKLRCNETDSKAKISEKLIMNL